MKDHPTPPPLTPTGSVFERFLKAIGLAVAVQLIVFFAFSWFLPRDWVKDLAMAASLTVLIVYRPDWRSAGHTRARVAFALGLFAFILALSRAMTLWLMPLLRG